MKVSEITVNDVIRYIREEPDNLTAEEIQDINNYLLTAKSFISSYTGIPIMPIIDPITLQPSKCLDDYEDFYIVVLVLCQDMYDNRSLYVDKNNLNKVVETILGMHSINLL